MAVPLDTQQDIREMDARGIPRARISRQLGVSRNTVAKYADMRDMSPRAPMPETRPHPAIDARAAWMGSVLEADLGAPRKQRHTARRILGRLVDEGGYEGSYSSVCRHVARRREESARTSPRDGCLELAWAPGTAQVDFGNFRCEIAGAARDMRPLVLAPPHSSARFCISLLSERSGCLCDGLRRIFERIGRAPSPLVLDDATEAGRMMRGKVTESTLLSQLRAHYRRAGRYCDPCPGNERGSVGNAVGFLGRNLLVPRPPVSPLGELNSMPRAGCGRIDARSRNREGRPAPKALAGDLWGNAGASRGGLRLREMGQGKVGRTWLCRRLQRQPLRGPRLAQPRARLRSAVREHRDARRTRPQGGLATRIPGRGRGRAQPRLAHPGARRQAPSLWRVDDRAGHAGGARIGDRAL